MTIQGELDSQGEIISCFPTNIILRKDQQVEVALVHMTTPPIHNFHGDPDMTFSWSLTEEDRRNNSITTELCKAEILKGRYETIGDVLKDIVTRPEPYVVDERKKLPMRGMRNVSYVLDVPNSVKVMETGDSVHLSSAEAYENMTAGEYYNELAAKNVFLTLTLSEALAKRLDSNHRHGRVDLNFGLVGKFDHHRLERVNSNFLSLHNMHHMMMDGLDAQITNGRPRPCLFSFTPDHLIHDPIHLKYIKYVNVESMGNLSQIREFRFWLEDENGQRIKQQAGNFTFSIRLRWTSLKKK